MFSIIRLQYPIDAKYRAFVEDSFLRSVTTSWPFTLCDWSLLRSDFRTRLRYAAIGVAVLKKDPDSYLGWAAVDPKSNTVVYAYTTAPYRSRQDGWDRLRVCSTLLTELGCDTTKTLGVTYWTKAADAISRHPGWKLERV